MSFYGSIYYQLLDAFNKIIIQNTGDKNTDFNTKLVNPSGTTEITISPAVGRRSSFALDTGNYWINFSKEPSNVKDEEGNGAAEQYKIWHSEPNAESAVNKIGIELTDISVDEDGNPTNKNLKYTQLKENDFFYGYQHKFDAAGHLLPDDKAQTLYRLPKSEISNRINVLEEYVGEPSKKLPIEDDNIENIFDYVEKSYDDMKNQQSYVGNWSAIANRWGNQIYDNNTQKWEDFKPTVQSVIGDMDNLYKEDENYINHKDQNIVSILGNQSQLWETFNDKNPISISDILIKHNKAFADKTSLLESSISGTGAMIGQPIDNDSVYDHIKVLYAEDQQIRKDFKSADEALETNITNAYKVADGELEDNLEKQIADKGEEIKTAYTQADSNLESKITNAYKADDAALKIAYEAADTALESKINEEFNNKIGNISDSTVKGYIDIISSQHTSDIAAVNQDIGKLQAEDTAIKESVELKANKDWIENQITALLSRIEELENMLFKVFILDESIIEGIENQEYKIPYNMTWRDWVNSSYSNGNYTISEDKIIANKTDAEGNQYYINGIELDGVYSDSVEYSLEKIEEVQE